MAKRILVVCDEQEKSVSLQQIPHSIKSIFKASEGHTFIDIDYSQMEYRVAASLSQDPGLMEIFNSDQDFYSSVAAKVYNKPMEEVSKDERAKTKIVAIGIMYGMHTASIAKRLGISEQEAATLRASFDKSFPKFMEFRQNVCDRIRQTGKTPSFFGRYRDFGDPSNLDDEKINEGFNTVIQSTSADLIKISMIMTDKYLSENKSGKLLLTLHDELLFEVPDDKVEEAQAELTKIMQESAKRSEKWCKFGCTVNVGKDWASASKE